jgi:hypothetical protein
MSPSFPDRRARRKFARACATDRRRSRHPPPRGRRHGPWAPSSNPGESAAARAFCRSGGRVVAASRADLAALTAASRPVAAALERDPVTRELISRTRALAGAPSAEGFSAPTCQPPHGNTPSSVRATGRTPLDGIYRNTLAVGDYTSAGVDQATAIQTAGIHTITLRNGRLHDTMRSDLAPQQPCDGTYSVHGLTFIFAWNKGTPCNGDFTAIWSLRGDQLRFMSVRSDPGDSTLWGRKAISQDRMTKPAGEWRRSGSTGTDFADGRVARWLAVHRLQTIKATGST